MLRHAQMPKGSRRAPNVYRRVHSRPRHTAQWVGFIFKLSRREEYRVMLSRAGVQRSGTPAKSKHPYPLSCSVQSAPEVGAEPSNLLD